MAHDKNNNGKTTLTGTDGDDSLFGGNGMDVLTGLGGNDTLDGGNGKDTMSGGAGNDIYIVNQPNEVITENPDEGDDTVFSRVTFTLGANLENLTLTGGIPAKGFGNELDNVLTGNNSKNVLVGYAGDDTLDGGGGADVLNGGAGNDVYIVDSGDKIIDSAGIDTVQASFSYTLAANLENLALTGTADINGTGNALGNAITGNAGVNILTGLGGDDTLDGGAGADTLIGGSGADTFLFKAATAFSSVDTVTDFNAAEGDKLDLGDLLTSFDPVTMALTDWVRISDSGSDSIVEVDRDGLGAGFSFTQIATLSGVTGLTDEDALAASGTLVIA